MPKKKRSDLKGQFKAGNIPTETDFADLIDSSINWQDEDIVKTGGTLKFEEKTIEAAFKGNGTELTHLNADNITSGTLTEEHVPGINADKITAGELSPDRIPGLNANKVTEGTLTVGRLPNLDADKITTGEFHSDRIPDLNADKITTGELNPDRIPSLDPAKISGELVTNQIPELDINQKTLGQLNADRLPQTSDQAQGAIQLATQDEVNTGTVNNKAITPATLNTPLEAKANKTEVNNEISNINTQISTINTSLINVDNKVENVDSKVLDVNTKVSDNYTELKNEVALLEAGIKFKQDVQAVAVTPVATIAKPELRTIDGYQLQDGDRVLLTNQTNQANNRVWVAKVNAIWEMAEDFDGNFEEELARGISVEVQNGDQYQHSIWTITAVNKDTDDSITQIQWKKRNDINDYQAGDGVTIAGQTVGVDKSWVEKNISLDNVNGGVLGSAQIPELHADKITAGVLSDERIPSLDAGKITTGVLGVEHVPGLDADKVSTGEVHQDRLPDANEAKAGIIRIATQDEINQGTATDIAVTPVSLSNVVNGLNAVDNNTLNTALEVKADKSYVNDQINLVKSELEKIDTIAIAGPKHIFAQSPNNTYSIDVPNATSYEWSADGLTITSSNTTETITIKAGDNSGTLYVKVKTDDNKTIEKSADIKIQIPHGSKTFEYTGNIESWSVPVGVEKIRIEARGAEGGAASDNNAYGGYGSVIIGEFNVNSNDTLNIVVGQQGLNGSGVSNVIKLRD